MGSTFDRSINKPQPAGRGGGILSPDEALRRLSTISMAKTNVKASQVLLYQAFHDLYRHFQAGGGHLCSSPEIRFDSFDDLCLSLLGRQVDTVKRRMRETLIDLLYADVLLADLAEERPLLPHVALSSYAALIAEINRWATVEWLDLSWEGLVQWITGQHDLCQRLIDVFLRAIAAANADSRTVPVQRDFKAAVERQQASGWGQPLQVLHGATALSWHPQPSPFSAHMAPSPGLAEAAATSEMETCGGGRPPSWPLSMST